MKNSYLADTHTFLWSAIDPTKLSSKVKRLLIDKNVQIYLSVASLWEISIKRSIGKLSLPTTTREFVTRAAAGIALEVLPITGTVTLEVEYLPPAHSDPFDRLIVAQAKLLGIGILSSDKQFDSYAVARVW